MNNSDTTGIYHFRATDKIELNKFIETQTGLPDCNIDKGQIQFWLKFGCVYVDGRRQRQNVLLHPDQVIRLHTKPKRYQWKNHLWPEMILWQDDHLLILDKPAGMPVHPTLDNFIENAKYGLEQFLQAPIFTTHRLDIPTQGLLVFAKNLAAQRQVNNLFSKKKVSKIYRALVPKSIAPGLYIHFIQPTLKPPRPIDAKMQDGWWHVQMRVDQCCPHPLGYALQITLLTGKTHQIRAQLSALGAPILGDQLYGSDYKISNGEIGLECYELSFKFSNQDFIWTRPKSISFCAYDNYKF